MSSTNFADGITLTDDDWFNDLNRLHYVIFSDPTNLASAQAAFFSATVGGAVVFANLQALNFSASTGSVNALSVRDFSVSAVAGLAVATQAQMEAASSIATIVSPGRVHFHPGMAKMWTNFNGSATSVTSGQGYNISAISDGGSGVYVIEFGTSFSSETGYAPVVSSSLPHTRTRSQSAGRITVLTNDFSDTAADAVQVTFVAYGDFA